MSDVEVIAEVRPEGTAAVPDRILPLLKRVVGEATPFARPIFAVFVFQAIDASLALLLPLPGKIVLDSVLDRKPLPGFLDAVLPASVSRQPESLLWFAVLLLLAVVIVRQLQSLISSVLLAKAGKTMVLQLRSRLFRHAQRLSLTFHDVKGITPMLYHIENDAQTLETLILDGVAPLTIATLTLLAMLYVMMRIDWQLALLSLTVTPALLLLTQLYNGRLRTKWRQMKEIETSTLAVVQEALSTLRVVKAFGQETREADRFDQWGHRGIAAYVGVTAMQGVLGLCLSTAIAAGTGAVLYVGARHVMAGTLSLGDLILLMFYLVMLYGPLETIAGKTTRLQGALVGAQRAFSLLDIVPEVTERARARRIERSRGAVVFDDVSFAYPNRPMLLRNVSADIPAGSIVGIAGEIGTGKTTLVNLLPRFCDATSGRILLDGVDHRDYRLADLREQFAIVPQDAVLFSTTIAENIAYGRPGASHDEIVLAAEKARAVDFIHRLPQGFDTTVGQRGMLLSNGQRQLISLARAFLRDAPILILDEPTSAIDMETEKLVMSALIELIKGRTVFMIAHRLHTLGMCDQLLYLKDGELVEPPALVRASAVC